MRAVGAGWEMRLGRWQDVIGDVVADALIFDAPYSEATHSSEVSRNDGSDGDGSTPSYSYLTPEDVHAFVHAWAPRCRGWMVSVTDDVLAPVWRAAYRSVGRYAFAGVPCVITGMTCRMVGDGPSSWAVYAMVSRPSTKEFATWGTLPGAYSGPRSATSQGGRGKPAWLPGALVRHYTRPGDLVVDPFAGWGTTLTAALTYGRRAMGAEMERAAYDKAVKALRWPRTDDLFASALSAPLSSQQIADEMGLREPGGAA